MIIKQSLADCNSCKLLNAESAIADTNCKENIRKTDILFIAENPGKDEVKGGKCEGVVYPAGTPLIGKAGTIFRKCFNKYIRDNFNYFITNTVLCVTIKEDGTTGNPDIETIEKCKVNCFNMIRECDPKLIVVMGSTPMKALLGMDSGITKNQGIMFSFKEPETLKEYNTLVVTHPSYVERNGGLDSEAGKQFENCFKQAKDYLNGQKAVTREVKSQKVSEHYKFRIPEKYYSSDFRLVDIQYISNKTQLIFIFRDKENNKVYYTPAPKELEYYWYEPISSDHRKLVEHVSDTELKIGSYGTRNYQPFCYESDRRLTDKHAIDYYLQTDVECPIIKRNIIFFDIEVYLGHDRSFPNIQEAQYPIHFISFAVDDGPVQVWILKLDDIDPNITKIADNFENLRVFDNEKQMILEWIKYIHNIDPDFMAGWNSNGFDWQYIYFRMKTLGLKTSMLSKFGNVFCDGNTKVDIAGMVCYDLLWLYKNLTYTNEPSYTLDNIAQKVLKKKKKEYEGTLDELYRTDVKTLIEYSFTDTNLLQGLDDALGHVALQDELRKAATTTHQGASSTIGLADGLFHFELKKSGLTMRNANRNPEENEGIIGAYVRQPIGGIYDWVIDFDYTSLYPSIICSFNIGPNTYVAKVSEEDAHAYCFTPKIFDKVFKGEVCLDPIYNTKLTKMSGDEFRKFMTDGNYIIAPSGCIFKHHSEEKSYFYHIIKKLFSQRKTYKKMMFDCKQAGDEFNKKIYGNMQLSYKILMNSLYGVIAQKYFRFFNLDLASSVTISGRELIKYAGEHINSWMEDPTNMKINPNFHNDVEKEKTYLKYCDTDSLFLWMKPYLESQNLTPSVATIKEQSAKLQKHLNGTLLKAYTKLHNIDQEESMFELKNELICKRYFCLNVKKKYALHVINNEGVDTDEIDIKGLEIRRSDFSSLTKDLLTNIIDMLFKTEEVCITDIDAFIKSIEHKALDLINKRELSIYKTVAFSKDLKEYKTIPQSIFGMLLWNTVEFDYFRPGMRGYLVPIQGIDNFKGPAEKVKKFLESVRQSKRSINAIVIPEDYHNVPDYYVIDTKKVLDFSIYERVELLLEPIKKKEPAQLKWDF